MNLLYYNESFNNPDGSSQHAYGLLKEFQNHQKINKIATYPTLHSESGSQNTVLCLKIGYSATEQCLRFAKRTIQSIYRYHLFLRKFNKFTPTIILSRVSLFDSTPLLISKKLNIPLIAEWNSPFFYETGILRQSSLIPLSKRWERKFLQSSEMVYTVSNQVKHLLSKEYHLSMDKFHTIPNGFDSNIYPKNKLLYQEQHEKIRFKLGWSNKTVIAFIGSLKTWHGIDHLIKIAEYFSRYDKSIQFIVIGDGEVRKSIIKASNSLKNITWTGCLPSSLMAKYLTGCDIGIMPYLPTGYFYFSPLKLYDMIGACLPSIGYSIGQIADVYDEYPEVGWGVKSPKLKEYIDLITYLQRNKTEIFQKRNRLIDSRFNHTWKIRVDNLIDIIEPVSNNWYDFRRRAN